MTARCSSLPSLQFESLCALRNIYHNTESGCDHMMKHNVHAILINILSSTKCYQIQEYAMILLCNIARANHCSVSLMTSNGILNALKWWPSINIKQNMAAISLKINLVKPHQKYIKICGYNYHECYLIYQSTFMIYQIVYNHPPNAYGCWFNVYHTIQHMAQPLRIWQMH